MTDAGPLFTAALCGALEISNQVVRFQVFKFEMQFGGDRGRESYLVHERVSSYLSYPLEPNMSLQLALVCAMRDPGDLIAFHFGAQIHRTSENPKTRKGMALTTQEWKSIFATLVSTGNSEIGTSGVVPADSATFNMLTAALRCTLAEPGPMALYQRGLVKHLCMAALYLDDPSVAIQDILGMLVWSDKRRLDALDTEGMQIMCMSKLVNALCQSVSVSVTASAQ
jgi:hypothetical protein